MHQKAVNKSKLCQQIDHSAGEWMSRPRDLADSMYRPRHRSPGWCSSAHQTERIAIAIALQFELFVAISERSLNASERISGLDQTTDRRFESLEKGRSGGRAKDVATEEWMWRPTLLQ
ncbi:hypothetical protein RHMOL_Rhmol01G0203300 [Rhododendron molle]|uniref:Uncharacterized protein n=1 Tax=Rhododendron molle TaxID=49168 RepID=A0ACC0Q421_RHOML|nr:hypothetical protein RHMOL_Rhmol01G0203300 [Rhododendron molle]